MLTISAVLNPFRAVTEIYHLETPISSDTNCFFNLTLEAKKILPYATYHLRFSTQALTEKHNTSKTYLIDNKSVIFTVGVGKYKVIYPNILDN
jgi:hypothetical protein